MSRILSTRGRHPLPSACWDTHTPAHAGIHPHPSRKTPPGDTPWADTSPPPAATAASYWNAFLLDSILLILASSFYVLQVQIGKNSFQEERKNRVSRDVVILGHSILSPHFSLKSSLRWSKILRECGVIWGDQMLSPWEGAILWGWDGGWFEARYPHPTHSASTYPYM